MSTDSLESRRIFESECQGDQPRRAATSPGAHEMEHNTRKPTDSIPDASRTPPMNPLTARPEIDAVMHHSPDVDRKSTLPDTERPRVCLITQWYSPEPVSVPMLTAKELRSAGLDVRVVTGNPNLPDGKIYSGYSAWRSSTEEIDGISVRRAPLYPNHSNNPTKRILNYLTWAISACLVGNDWLRSAEVNIVHCTPATAAIPALMARVLHGRPYIVIVQDLWPDTVEASGFVRRHWVRGVMSKVLRHVVGVLYGNAEVAVSISHGMCETLMTRGLPPERSRVIYNSVDEELFTTVAPGLVSRADYGVHDDEFVLVYAGNQGSAQDLSTLVKAVTALSSEAPVRLLLVGWGVEQPQLKKLASLAPKDCIQFIDRVSQHEVRRIQSVADLCVVSLGSNPLFRVTVPSKLQTLLAAGFPILGIVEGDARAIIEESGAGYVADPGEVDSVVRAILSAMDEPRSGLRARGAAGRRYYLAEMSSRSRSIKLREAVNMALRVDGSRGAPE